MDGGECCRSRPLSRGPPLAHLARRTRVAAARRAQKVPRVKGRVLYQALQLAVERLGRRELLDRRARRVQVVRHHRRRGRDGARADAVAEAAARARRAALLERGRVDDQLWLEGEVVVGEGGVDGGAVGHVGRLRLRLLVRRDLAQLVVNLERTRRHARRVVVR
eukprot:3999409-Prymnesium_polylepis.1